MVMLVLATIWFVQRKALRSQRFSILGGKSQRGTRIKLGPVARVVARLALLGYLVVAAVLPVVALLLVALNGFWTTRIRWGELGPHSFADALHSALDFPGTGLALRNSLLLAALTATVSLAVAGLISWWTLHSRSRFAAGASLAIKIPAAVSTVVLAVGFVLAFGGPPAYLGGTVLILFLAYLAIAMPEASVTAESAVGQVGKDLDEASRVSGAGEARTFLRVYIPLMLPGLAAGWALVFVRTVGDLEASAILAGTGNPVVGFQILGLITSADYAGLAALALLLTALSATVVTIVLMVVRKISVRSS
jgi:iron(III) transport system permease protein